MAVTQASGNTGNLTDVNLRSFRVLNDGTVALAMCNPDGTYLNSVLNSTITSTSANALVVGPNGGTNPTFNVDASTASAATGVNVKGAAAGGGVAVSTLSSGTNENLTVDAKGTGTVGINTVGTSSGLVTLGNATSLAGAAVNGPLTSGAQTITSNSANATAVGPNGTTNPTLKIDASTSSAATGILVKSAAAAAGAAVSVISSGTNENLTVDAKGSGTITLGGTSTGNIVLNRNVTFGGTRSGGTPAIISGSGATVTLTAAQSGSVVMFDRAAGIVFTLPTPAVGLNFAFYTPVSVTSNNYKVITDTGTTLLIGSLVNVKTDLTTLFSIGNGTTHISVTMNGTTTGGLIGTYLKFTCVSSTLWSVEGSNLASGTIATPFATS